MKILLSGATGNIGRAVLDRCLKNPAITTLVAFVRRPLPDEIASNPAVKTVMISDFANWPGSVLAEHIDAKAMIWCLGDYEGRRDVSIDFPLAFQNGFVEARRLSSQSQQEFRYVHLSGKLTEQDQTKHLYFYESPRKLKGTHELRAIELAERNRPWWKLIIVRPGGVLANTGCLAKIGELTLGESWAVRSEELAAYMTYVAVSGDEQDTIVTNQAIVQKGRHILKDGF